MHSPAADRIGANAHPFRNANCPQPTRGPRPAGSLNWAPAWGAAFFSSSEGSSHGSVLAASHLQAKIAFRLPHGPEGTPAEPLRAEPGGAGRPRGPDSLPRHDPG